MAGRVEPVEAAGQHRHRGRDAVAIRRVSRCGERLQRGPVGGADDVLAFLEEIREIMTTELPAATDGSTATPEVRA